MKYMAEKGEIVVKNYGLATKLERRNGAKCRLFSLKLTSWKV